MVSGSDRWAVHEAIELAGVARQVTLVLDPRVTAADELAAFRALPNAAVQAGRVVALEGDDGLERAIVETDGGRRPHAVRGLFVYDNQRPATAILGGKVALDAAGHVEVDTSGTSSATSILAAGDARSGTSRTIAAAIDDGRRAAERALALLRTRAR